MVSNPHPRQPAPMLLGRADKVSAFPAGCTRRTGLSFCLWHTAKIDVRLARLMQATQSAGARAMTSPRRRLHPRFAPWCVLYVAAAMLLSLLVIPDVAQPASSSPRYTFYLTHYELLGNPPQGVRYHSNGQPFAKNRTGDTLALSGKGAWEPRSRGAVGGGAYTIKNSKGTVTAQGSRSVSDFISFQQMSGWWDKGMKELGWQGPSGSVSFSGFLALTVNLQKKRTQSSWRGV